MPFLLKMHEQCINRVNVREALMFFVKKCITYFVIPPGIFIVLFIISGLLSKRRIASITAFVSAFLLYGLSIEPIKDFLVYPLEKQYIASMCIPSLSGKNAYQGDVAKKLTTIDAIVVLGGGVYENGTLKEDSANRMLAGYSTHALTHKTLILSGGSAIGNVRESNIIYTMLLQLNVNKNKIIIENTSRDTMENAHNVMKMCNNNGWHRIALITSAYHMPRAVKLFHASSLHVEPVPTDSKLDLHYTVYSFMPKFSSLGNSSKAIREYIALIVLYIMGN